MSLFLNPQCDVVYGRNEAEFLFFDRIVQIEGDGLGEILAVTLQLLEASKGCSLQDIQEALSGYSQEELTTLIRTTTSSLE